MGGRRFQFFLQSLQYGGQQGRIHVQGYLYYAILNRRQLVPATLLHLLILFIFIFDLTLPSSRLRVWQAEGWQPGTPTPTDSDNTYQKEGGNFSSQVPRPRNNCFLKKNNFDYKSKNIKRIGSFSMT